MHGEDVQPHHGLLLGAVPRDQHPLRPEAGVVHQEVDETRGVAHPLAQAGCHPLYPGVGREVGGDRLDAKGALLGQRMRRHRQPIGVARDEHERVAGAGELSGIGGTQAGGSPRDERGASDVRLRHGRSMSAALAADRGRVRQPPKRLPGACSCTRFVPASFDLETTR